MRNTAADVVGLDWSVDMKDARATLGQGVKVQVRSEEGESSGRMTDEVCRGRRGAAGRRRQTQPWGFGRATLGQRVKVQVRSGGEGAVGGGASGSQ